MRAGSKFTDLEGHSVADALDDGSGCPRISQTFIIPNFLFGKMRRYPMPLPVYPVYEGMNMRRPTGWDVRDLLRGSLVTYVCC